MKIYFKVLIYIIIAITLCSCPYTPRISPIPDAPVNYTLNIQRDAPVLALQGGYIEIVQPEKQGQYIGYSGLLIFHGFDDKFYAYDLCCPNECDRSTRVSASMAGIAKCECCGAQYDIGFGTGAPLDTICREIMRSYTVVVAGDNIRVTQ